MQRLLSALLMAASVIGACAPPGARSAAPVQVDDAALVHFDYADLVRFGETLDHIADGADTTRAFAAYIEGGSSGLRAWHRRYTLRPERYAQRYAQAPRFFRYLAGLSDSLRSREPRIRMALVTLRTRAGAALDADLALPPVSYFVTPLGGGGGAGQDVLMIGVDSYGRNSDAPLGEFRRGFFPQGETPMQNLDGLVVATVHELAHYYQRRAQGWLGYARMYLSRKDDTLLGRAVREGCAEFLAELTVGYLTPDQAAFGRPREAELWRAFRARIEQPTDSNPGWFSGRNPQFPDAPWQIGYWIGARMCGAYYRRHPDPQAALGVILRANDADVHWEMVRAYEAALGATTGRN